MRRERERASKKRSEKDILRDSVNNFFRNLDDDIDVPF